ncbi:ribosomal protein S18 acetylase RimI-like enzyme [Nocardiopsis sp. Huas11]|uniref:GNAT family N-acetyltransferase n=1 Tax=Nocardiopsis sp. Huas11 TaxID=2183912 RepID=UPI000EB081AB|nr:GNAT family N-acetyltransferase [Nocardiopsis sp. Huas11]RKS08748.1 ribosomal protein S18 acetylase RimI-like enzyme [Nocardiopsis sp. Huas11]
MTSSHHDQDRPDPAYRDADPADVPALVDLVNSCYRGDSSQQGWTTEADLLDGQRVDADGLLALLARTDTRLLVVELDGDLVACCELRRDGQDAYFGMFSVRPGRQGGGLGRIVLAEAERTAVAGWGSRRMRMKVIRQRTELIAWYERRGYKSTGNTEPFPYGDEAFGLPKRSDLEFVELVRDLPVDAG